LVLILEFEIGNIVISTMGRDKGLYFIVVGVEKNYVYLVDGSVRKIDKPKKKKVKHIELTNLHDENIAAKVINKHKITNQDIKKALRDILKVN
jgi:ribosomal protein L14E/L6E/L27E